MTSYNWNMFRYMSMTCADLDWWRPSFVNGAYFGGLWSIFDLKWETKTRIQKRIYTSSNSRIQVITMLILNRECSEFEIKIPVAAPERHSLEFALVPWGTALLENTQNSLRKLGFRSSPLNRPALNVRTRRHKVWRLCILICSTDCEITKTEVATW